MNHPPLLPSSEPLVAVVAKYGVGLRRYAARLTGDWERARDVVQETLAAFCATGDAVEAGRVGPWLFAVCRRKALNVRRKEARVNQLGRLDEERLADPGEHPAVGLVRAEEQARLRALLDQLPEGLREVVRLRYQEGFSYAEIAEITERSGSHVGVMLHQAVQRLRRDWMAGDAMAG